MSEESAVKKNILDAARKVFSQYGYKKTSMSDIAKESGKAKSSLYHYFESKEAIFVTVIKEKIDLLFNSSVEDASKVADPVGKIHAFIFSGKENINKICKEFGDILLTELFDFLPLIKETILEYVDQRLQFMKLIIDDGVGKGIFKTDNSFELAFIIEFSFWGFSENHIMGNFFGNSKINPDVTEKLFDTLISGISV